jgi:hypothetical protein
MIENSKQFDVTLDYLGKFLDGLDKLQRTILPKNPQLYALMAESVMEDIRRLRKELQEYGAAKHAAG